MDKRVRISIKYGDEKPQVFILNGHFFKRVGLEYNNKHVGFFSVTRILNRQRELICEYFNKKQ